MNKELIKEGKTCLFTFTSEGLIDFKYEPGVVRRNDSGGLYVEFKKCSNEMLDYFTDTQITELWSPEKIKEKLLQAHEQENEMNKEAQRLFWLIRDSQNKKKKLAERISRNMKYRNKLINLL